MLACHPSLKECTTFYPTKKQLKAVYKGSFIQEGNSYKYSITDTELANSKLSTSHSQTPSEFNEKNLSEFKIRVYGNPDIQLDSKSKVLNFTLKDPSDKIVIYDGVVNDWKINGLSAVTNSLNVPDVRFDTHLLTSSFTIQDSVVDNLEIIFNGGLLEDSVNLVRVKGHVSSIEVSNSPQDALDIDFSDLNIDSVAINTLAMIVLISLQVFTLFVINILAVLTRHLLVKDQRLNSIQL